MILTELKAVLAAHPEKTMRFFLPSGKSIPAHFHITEVGRVQKDFIDCGGMVRTQAACVLQAWVAANDEDHRLDAEKLSTILAMAEKILVTDELPVELEYEAPVFSQFPVTGWTVAGSEIHFTLSLKRTDCLAKESCGLEGAACVSDGEESCCC